MTTSYRPENATTRREIEARAGVESLDTLQHKRREKVAELAPLRAKRDTFDARRKEKRGAILVLINHERTKRGEKEVAATLAETVASGDDRYRQFLDQSEADFARLAILENDVRDLTERIESRKAELYFTGAEARLG